MDHKTTGYKLTMPLWSEDNIVSTSQQTHHASLVRRQHYLHKSTSSPCLCGQKTTLSPQVNKLTMPLWSEDNTISTSQQAHHASVVRSQHYLHKSTNSPCLSGQKTTLSPQVNKLTMPLWSEDNTISTSQQAHLESVVRRQHYLHKSTNSPCLSGQKTTLSPQVNKLTMPLWSEGNTISTNQQAHHASVVRRQHCLHKSTNSPCLCDQKTTLSPQVNKLTMPLWSEDNTMSTSQQTHHASVVRRQHYVHKATSSPCLCGQNTTISTQCR